MITRLCNFLIRHYNHLSMGCAFCIEKKGIGPLKQDVDKMIQSTVNSGKKEILILGGEPFLSPVKLLAYIQGIKGKGVVEKIFITTSLPKTIDVNNVTVKEILDLITGLNISLQHFKPEINNQVLNAKFKHDRIKLLESIVSNPAWQEKVRVSINLVNGYVDNKKTLESFLELLQNIGVKNVKINELQHEKNLSVSFEKIMSVKMKSPFAFGCQTELKLDNYPKLKIILKRGCFKVNENLHASLFDLLKVISIPLKRKVPRLNTYDKNNVLYENGDLKPGWIIAES